MSSATASPPKSKPVTKAKAKEKLKPPPETFWQRYSPNYEFPLSSVTSVATHFMMFGFVVIVAVYFTKHRSENDRPAALDTVAFAGGGGDPNGVEENQNRSSGGGDSVVFEPGKTSKVEIPKLDDKDIQPTGVPTPKAIDFETFIQQNKEVGEQVSKRPQLDQSLIKGLAQGPQSKGQGGLGSGGGKGAGDGKGTGSGAGEGVQNTGNQRVKRQLRWTMNFNTFDGNDYARQLEDLGAIIAALQPGDPPKFTVITNLAKPSKKQVMDNKQLSELNRIFWDDSNPGSIRELCVVLNITPVPPRLYAFFPRELEAKLLDLELDYAKKHGNRGEADIEETIFVVKRKTGKYHPEIFEQKYK